MLMMMIIYAVIKLEKYKEDFFELKKKSASFKLLNSI